MTFEPGPMPAGSPSGISSVRPARKPTTSAGTDGAPAAGLDRADLTDLGLEARGLGDQADQVDDAAGPAVEVSLVDRQRGLVKHVVGSTDRVERASINENI